MATDLSVIVFDPDLGAVVYARWLGGTGTLEAARDVLRRSPTTTSTGLECWAPITRDEAERIAAAHYADGATPEDIARLSIRFPCSRYIWMVVRDF